MFGSSVCLSVCNVYLTSLHKRSDPDMNPKRKQYHKDVTINLNYITIAD